MKILQKLQWQQTYKVIILIYIIVYLFRIGLRKAVGFVKDYMKQIGKNLKVISYKEAFKRFKKLNIDKDHLRIFELP